MSSSHPREILESGLSKARSGDYPGARDEFQRITESLPDFPDAFFYLGLACARLGEDPAARTAFERCLELDPFYDEARKQLRLLRSEPDGPPPAGVPAQPQIPEGYYAFSVKPAGFWIRALAVVIDGFLTAAAAGPFVFLASIPFFSSVPGLVDMSHEEIAEQILAGDMDLLLVLLLGMVVEFTVALILNTVYYSFFHYASGQTPGKRILGIRVVDSGTLDYLGGGQSVGRYMASALNWLICGVGFLMAAFNPEKRALHDYLAGTRVVYSESVPMTVGEKGATMLVVLLAGGYFLLRLIDALS